MDEEEMVVCYFLSSTLRVSWRGDNNLKLGVRPGDGSKHHTGAVVLDRDYTVSASFGLFGDVFYFWEIQACRFLLSS